jgi:hypothetical protein
MTMRKIRKKSLVNIVLLTLTACNTGPSTDKRDLSEISLRYIGLRRDNHQLLWNTPPIKNKEIVYSKKLSLVPLNDIKIKKTRYNATFNKRSY